MSDELFARTRAALLDLGVTERSALVLGVSGGIDSMTLGYVLNELRKSGAFARLVFCHVDHKLRGDESDADAEFVRIVAGEWNVEVEIVELGIAEASDLRASPSEASARSARYAAFERVATRLDIDTIATAHTSNDQAETVLMRMIRGAGPRGLAGIPRERSLNKRLRVIRPLLGVSRADLLEFASRHEIPLREDSTNATRIYLRNRVRHELLPMMESMTPSPIVETLSRMADLMRHQSRYFDAEAEMLFFQDDRKEIELDLFLQSPQPIKFAAIELLMKRGGSHEMLTTRTFGRILHWLETTDQENRPNSVFEIQGGFRLRAVNGRIGIGRQETIEKLESRELLFNRSIHTIEGEIILALEEGAQVTNSATRVYFDHDALGCDHLIVRSWRSGDRMNPFGMEGRKLISDLLLEAGFAAGSRKTMYPIVIHSSTGEILWLPGIRRSNGYPVTSATQRMAVCSIKSAKAH